MRVAYVIFILIIPHLATAQVYKPLAVDLKRDFKFRNEGKVIRWWDEEATVSSDMLVNNDTLTKIQFTRAKLRGDTLHIEIYQSDEAHDHHYTIEVIKDKYTIGYNFSYPADTTGRKIQTLDFTLTLNTKSFKRGKTIKGYTEFKGKCVENCYGDIITAKGYFKVAIE